jgi:hypothetical protein
VRVTVVGGKVFAQQIAAPDGALDWRRGHWDDLMHAPITVPAPIEAALHHYLTSFDLVTGTPRSTGPPSSAIPTASGWLPDAEQITEAFADILTTEGGSRP